MRTLDINDVATFAAPDARVERDPHVEEVAWRCVNGERQVRYTGIWFRVTDQAYFAEHFPATPERIAMWVALQLTPCA